MSYIHIWCLSRASYHLPWLDRKVSKVTVFRPSSILRTNREFVQIQIRKMDLSANWLATVAQISSFFLYKVTNFINFSYWHSNSSAFISSSFAENPNSNWRLCRLSISCRASILVLALIIQVLHNFVPIQKEDSVNVQSRKPTGCSSYRNQRIWFVFFYLSLCLYLITQFQFCEEGSVQSI